MLTQYFLLQDNDENAFGNNPATTYFIMHDKQPYQILFSGNAKNYEKYLPEFEQIVKSFGFTDSQFSETEKLENENITNTATNFSGANLSESELYTNSTDGDSNYPEELYDECVNVAEKSFCDSLFMR